jgi:hypothetical protein
MVLILPADADESMLVDLVVVDEVRGYKVPVRRVP